MADSTSIEINATDTNDKKLKTTISYVNPNAQPSTLKQFALKLNNLTTNVYESTTRIDKTELDTATDKQARNVVVSYTDYSGGGSGTKVTIVDGTATVPVSALQNVSGARRLVVDVSNQPALTDDISRLMLTDVSTTVGVTAVTNYLASNNYQFSCTLSSVEAQVITFKLALAENDKYAGWSQTFTITITDEGGE